MYRLFIDDDRFPADKDSNMFIVRTYEEAVHCFVEQGCPSFISFDHDLGPNSLEGIDIAWWLVNKDMDSGGEFIPKEFTFYVHSQNPIGGENITMLLNNYLRSRN
jgi:hypothetical protein